MRPRLFADDLKFIRDLGDATDLTEAKASVEEFQDINFARRGFLRRRLKIRVSGRKAMRLARELL